jgi:hypothetical protein
MGVNICATLGGNLGQPACDVRMGRPKFLLLTRGKVFSAADLADSDSFKAALTAAMRLARTDNNKVFCSALIRVADDNTSDPNAQTLADGYQEILNESLPSFTLQSTIGICQAQEMIQFNGWKDKVFVIDSNNVVWFVQNSSAGGNGFTTGYMYTDPPRFGNSQNIQVTKTKLVFGTLEEFKSNVGAIKIDFDASKLVNTVDVVLSEKAAAAGYAFKMGGAIKCAGIDIFTDYQDLLAVIGAWKATRLDTNAAVAIATTVKDAVNKLWTVTLDNATAITTGVKIRIELVDPTALHALGTPVDGIESISVIVIKP